MQTMNPASTYTHMMTAMITAALRVCRAYLSDRGSFALRSCFASHCGSVLPVILGAPGGSSFWYSAGMSLRCPPLLSWLFHEYGSAAGVLPAL